MPRVAGHHVLAAAMAALLLLPAAARSQDGTGTAGGQVLQFPAGTRGAALSGAHMGLLGDAEQIFYNPAGLAPITTAVGLSVQRHVEDMLLGSLAGAHRLGRVVIGAGAVFFSSGDIRVVEPDPDFGGERGRETGATARATELAARLAVAMQLPDERLRVGAALGLLTSDVAGLGRNAPFVDVGVHYDLGPASLGAALQHVGGALTGAGAESADLPSQARLGAGWTYRHGPDVGVRLSGDLLLRLKEGTQALLTGLEAGLLPHPERRLSAVGRIGFRAESDEALGRLVLGAGLTMENVGIDYAYQSLAGFGGAHRLGVRWHAAGL